MYSVRCIIRRIRMSNEKEAVHLWLGGLSRSPATSTSTSSSLLACLPPLSFLRIRPSLFIPPPSYTKGKSSPKHNSTLQQPSVLLALPIHLPRLSLPSPRPPALGIAGLVACVSVTPTHSAVNAERSGCDTATKNNHSTVARSTNARPARLSLPPPRGPAPSPATIDRDQCQQLPQSCPPPRHRHRPARRPRPRRRSTSASSATAHSAAASIAAGMSDHVSGPASSTPEDGGGTFEKVVARARCGENYR
jgi:hypothetical protein